MTYDTVPCCTTYRAMPAQSQYRVVLCRAVPWVSLKSPGQCHGLVAVHEDRIDKDVHALEMRFDIIFSLSPTHLGEICVIRRFMIRARKENACTSLSPRWANSLSQEGPFLYFTSPLSCIASKIVSGVFILQWAKALETPL